MSNHRELLEKSDIFQVGGAVLKIYPPTSSMPRYAKKKGKSCFGAPLGKVFFVKGIIQDRIFKDRIIQLWLKTFKEVKKVRRESEKENKNNT